MGEFTGRLMVSSASNLEKLDVAGVRMIGKFYVKDGLILRTRQLEGLRAVEAATPGILKHSSFLREVLLIDLVATLYRKPPPLSWLKELRKDLRLPITFAGGISSLSKAEAVISAGADRIAVNSILAENFSFGRELIDAFGSQSVIIQVDVRKFEGIYWPFSHSSRVKMEEPLTDWLARLDEYGDCEVIVTSISAEGTGRGFPEDLIQIVSENASRPVVLSGGHGDVENILDLNSRFPGVSFASSSMFLSNPNPLTQKFAT